MAMLDDNIFLQNIKKDLEDKGIDEKYIQELDQQLEDNLMYTKNGSLTVKPNAKLNFRFKGMVYKEVNSALDKIYNHYGKLTDDEFIEEYDNLKKAIEEMTKDLQYFTDRVKRRYPNNSKILKAASIALSAVSIAASVVSNLGKFMYTFVPGAGVAAPLVTAAGSKVKTLADWGKQKVNNLDDYRTSVVRPSK